MGQNTKHLKKLFKNSLFKKNYTIHLLQNCQDQNSKISSFICHLWSEAPIIRGSSFLQISNDTFFFLRKRCFLLKFLSFLAPFSHTLWYISCQFFQLTKQPLHRVYVYLFNVFFCFVFLYLHLQSQRNENVEKRYNF